jgi:glycosyltransferase involved in cell wall biosynthesis
MRIAIDARAAAEVPAGRGRYVRELLNGLARLDGDHEFLLFAREVWAEASLDQRFQWRTVAAGGLAWPLSTGNQMSRSADVALACTSYAMTLPLRIPCACIVWDFASFDRRLQAPRGSLLERLTLPIAVRRAGAFIAISESTRRELEQRFPATRSRTSVAHPGTDARFSSVARDDDAAVLARHGLNHPYVLVTGTLEPRKNLPRLIEAFAGLEREVREDTVLVLVGATGWQTDRTFAALSEHGHLVQALGYIPDAELACVYRHAKLLCYMSLYEGFGIPVLEAMSSGTAVLTSAVASMPEVGGDAARYADPLDVADIRRGLRELLTDGDLRARCGAAGIARATSFDWTASAGIVLATLAGLAERGRFTATSE